ncbi:hypothetical protein PR048_014041 [Dryococelus australis]|uniref:Uncharacterized protein n=1 Tax=Dryococelus australis TaxID=614101 RepID=A0ABQ9HTX3_9NEOP|nr:hypothetical protein PR048_014041 [Dryococelus australis]
MVQTQHLTLSKVCELGRLAEISSQQLQCLLFGISCELEKFQELNLCTFGDICGAASLQEQHDQTRTQVLQRARDQNIKFNPEKLQYKVSIVSFMEHLFSNNEISPDPDRIAAIQCVPDPQNRKELQKQLGMVNFPKDHSYPTW